MQNDDETIGRILSRRDLMALLGAAGAGVLARGLTSPQAPDLPTLRLPSSPVPNCVVRPAQTEGPYFVDGTLDRRDIRSDPATGVAKTGVPLGVEFRVSQVAASGCTPLAGARVELWQCDALGVYSGARDMNGLFDTRNEKFLRGHQITDAAGVARFSSVYPGWYEGRAVHLHFSVRAKNAAGRDVLFTSQLYFDDTVTAQVLQRAPYAQKGTANWVRNSRDGIFNRSGGEQLMLALRPQGEGYAGIFELGMQLA